MGSRRHPDRDINATFDEHAVPSCGAVMKLFVHHPGERTMTEPSMEEHTPAKSR
jgi:hypothetical protein